MRGQRRHIAGMGVTNIAAPRTRAPRSARTVRAEPVQPTARDLGKRIEAEFQTAAEGAVHQALAAGVPVAVLTKRKQVAWLHPDGVVRPTRDPVHTPLSR
jgi:hypothetical protein